MIVTDRQARIERFNRAAEEVTGFAAGDMIGKSLIETLMPPESVEDVRAELAAAIATEFPRHYEHGLLTADGGLRLVSWTVACLTDAEGEITHLVATGTDVTETRRAADALRISTGWLEGCIQEVRAELEPQMLPQRERLSGADVPVPEARSPQHVSRRVPPRPFGGRREGGGVEPPRRPL